MEDERRNRILTDEDVEAITDALRDQFMQQLYNDIGRGIFSIAWRFFITILIGIAAYGAAKGISFKD